MTAPVFAGLAAMSMALGIIMHTPWLFWAGIILLVIAIALHDSENEKV